LIGEVKATYMRVRDLKTCIQSECAIPRLRMVNKNCDSRFGQMKPEVNVTEINATPLNRTVMT